MMVDDNSKAVFPRNATNVRQRTQLTERTQRTTRQATAHLTLRRFAYWFLTFIAFVMSKNAFASGCRSSLKNLPKIFIRPSSGGFRPGPEGTNPLPEFCSRPFQFCGHPWFFAKMTHFLIIFMFFFQILEKRANLWLPSNVQKLKVLQL